MAAGGTIDFTVAGVMLQVITLVGETPTEVAANIAAAINTNPTLQGLGMSAIADADQVITNGVVSAVTINDAGLTHALGPAAVPATRSPILLVLAILMFAIAMMRIRGRSALGSH